MGDELSLDMARHQVDPAQYLTCLQAPDSAGGVNTGGTYREETQDLLNGILSTFFSPFYFSMRPTKAV
jgi:hypothetical protein